MDLSEIEKTYPLRVPVAVAAEAMEVTLRYLQTGLQQGKFPFGVSVEFARNEYYINTTRFVKYMRGEC